MALEILVNHSHSLDRMPLRPITQWRLQPADCMCLLFVMNILRTLGVYLAHWHGHTPSFHPSYFLEYQKPWIEIDADIVRKFISSANLKVDIRFISLRTQSKNRLLIAT